jgi:O-antigen/teichoic acid export membrane protein
MLGLFFSPAIVGIYYVAQQVASLPQKLKTSFDPILGPVITQNLAEGNKAAVAKQVRQVGFWILAAQIAIALALSIPGKAVMGLVGPSFVGGTGALAVLLAAEAIAATAVVSEAALIYIAAKRNLAISVAMIAGQAVASVLLIYAIRAFHPVADLKDDVFAAAGPAIALMLMLGVASVAKARLLARLLRHRVSGWRWPLVPAAAAGSAVGAVATLFPEWAELLFGVPLILGAYGAVIWYRGFGEEDRLLFSMKPGATPQPA